MNGEEMILDMLQNHHFAWAEYISVQQMKSGWSCEVFFKTALDGAYSLSNSEYDYLRITFRDRSDILEKYFKDFVLSTRTLMKICDALDYAKVLSKRNVGYTDLEVVNFCKDVLDFTLDHFKYQVGEVSNPQIEAELRLNVLLAQKGEDFNFQKYYLFNGDWLLDNKSFELSVKKLLIESMNTDEIRIMLKPLHSKAKDIVSLWNGRLLHIFNRSRDKIDINNSYSLKVKLNGSFVHFTIVSEINLYGPYYNLVWPRRLEYYASAILKIIDEVLESKPVGITNVPLTKTKKKHKKQYEKFEDLFQDPDKMERCLKILSQLEEPSITSDLKKLIGKKNVIVIWVKLLIEERLMDSVSYKVVAELIRNKFGKDAISNSLFSKIKSLNIPDEILHDLKKGIQNIPR